MAFTETQKDIVARYLANKIAGNEYPVLGTLFGGEVTKRIRKHDTPYAYAMEVLKVCEERFREGDRTWCDALWQSDLSLVVEVHAVFKVHQEGMEEEERLRQLAATADPFADMRICRGNAFLARRELRRELKRLANDDRSILLVDGPSRSGRSYTHKLIQHIAEQRGQFRVAWSDCSGPSLTLSASGLAQLLSLSIGRPPGQMPTQEAQEPRWAQQLAQWVLAHDAEAASRWWLVFDGFEGTELAPGARAFIEHLAQRIGTGPARQRFRLVLLQYPQPMPTVLRREVATEKLQPPDTVGPKDVSEYFEWLMRRRNETITSEGLQKLVNSVFERVEDTGDHLGDLCIAVEEVSDQLLGDA
ncbi:hypothetical protein ACLESD_06035 [Pyxidicoccus sp. 3LFB2]